MLDSNNQVYTASDVHLKSTLKLSALKFRDFSFFRDKRCLQSKTLAQAKLKGL